MPPQPRILFDVITRSVAIMFGEEVVTLQGPFAKHAEAMEAAMEECAARGWLAGGTRYGHRDGQSETKFRAASSPTGRCVTGS